MQKRAHGSQAYIENTVRREFTFVPQAGKDCWSAACAWLFLCTVWVRDNIQWRSITKTWGMMGNEQT